MKIARMMLAFAGAGFCLLGFMFSFLDTESWKQLLFLAIMCLCIKRFLEGLQK